MNCKDAGFFLHALLDGELDAGHAREVEGHIADCPGCAKQLVAFRDMRVAMAGTDLRFRASRRLRQSLDKALPGRVSLRDRRGLLKGFALGGALSGAIAAGLVAVVLRDDRGQRIAGDVVNAHLRSLQAEHLTDVQSTDQHTVKPWFNGRLDVAPPVVDLTAQGFTLIGGRLDYIDRKPVAALVYKRRAHVINVFVMDGSDAEGFGTMSESVQGFNLRRWFADGLAFFAVSDVNAEELDEFQRKFALGARVRAISSGG